MDDQGHDRTDGGDRKAGAGFGAVAVHALIQHAEINEVVADTTHRFGVRLRSRLVAGAAVCPMRLETGKPGIYRQYPVSTAELSRGSGAA